MNTSNVWKLLPLLILLAAGAPAGETHDTVTNYRGFVLAPWAPSVPVASLTNTTGGAMPATGTWHYALAAQNSLGISGAGPVTNVTVATGELVRITWRPVGGATNYLIYRGTVATSLTQRAVVGLSTSYVDHGTNAWTTNSPASTITNLPALLLARAGVESNEPITVAQLAAWAGPSSGTDTTARAWAASASNLALSASQASTDATARSWAVAASNAVATRVQYQDAQGFTNSGGVLLSGPVTLGGANVVTAQYGFAAGRLTAASGSEGANANGYGSVSSGSYGANANGRNTTASGINGANANGLNTVSSGINGVNANGSGTTASGSYGANANGYNTVSSGNYGANANGSGTVSSGTNGTWANGWNTTASGDYSSAAGGSGNVAGGKGSFAAGVNAKATNQGSFVWSDHNTGTYVGSPMPNSFTIRATNGWYSTQDTSDPALVIRGNTHYGDGSGLTNTPLHPSAMTTTNYQAAVTNYLRFLTTATPPASNTASGSRGEVRTDSTNLYLYTASNLWLRVPGSYSW